jgi:hypothetical protein
MFYCGIDWAWEELTLVVVDDNANPTLEEFKLKDSLEGFLSALSAIRYTTNSKTSVSLSPIPIFPSLALSHPSTASCRFCLLKLL